MKVLYAILALLSAAVTLVPIVALALNIVNVCTTGNWLTNLTGPFDLLIVILSTVLFAGLTALFVTLLEAQP